MEYFGANLGLMIMDLRDLPPLTTVVVRTMKSMYRVVVTQWPEVYVHGGAFFPEPARAYLDGARLGGNGLKIGCITVGLRMEIRSEGRRIVTSPVCAVTTEQK